MGALVLSPRRHLSRLRRFKRKKWSDQKNQAVAWVKKGSWLRDQAKKDAWFRSQPLIEGWLNEPGCFSAFTAESEFFVWTPSGDLELHWEVVEYRYGKKLKRLKSCVSLSWDWDGLRQQIKRTRLNSLWWSGRKITRISTLCYEAKLIGLQAIGTTERLFFGESWIVFENSKGDQVMSVRMDNVYIREVWTHWTKDVLEENGGYPFCYVTLQIRPIVFARLYKRRSEIMAASYKGSALT